MTTTAVQPLDLLPADETDDQPIQELIAPMPPWLSNVEQPVRDEYCHRLVDYHASAEALESHLEQVLPSFEDFIRETVAARVKEDQRIDLDPDTVFVDLPVSVWRDYRIDPQFARVTNYQAPWVASSDREQLSLSELARRNFAADDEQMARRLDFVQIHNAPALTGAWLHAIIPQLDVTQRYRNRLRQVFRVDPAIPEQERREAERLLQPYARKIELEAFCERARRRLSEEGYQLLRLAAQARCTAETDAVDLEMNWLQFRPGTAVSGEHDSHTLAGLCMIRHQHSGHTVIYLPDAPADVPIIEASDPLLARSRLIQHLLGKPALVNYLAERTLDPQRVASHANYINQALARGFDGFIQFVPALDLQIAAQQLHARAWMLERMTRISARSRFDIQTERNWQESEACLGYLKAWLSLLPGIGTLVSVQDGWLGGHDAAKAFGEGRLNDGMLALGGTALSVLDVVFSVVPGATGIFVLARMVRRGARLRAASSGLRRHVVKPFDGYEVPTSLSTAVPQTGRDLGTRLKDGQLWIEREGRVYGVYRRNGEQTLRLRKTPLHGYEPPVRFENGAWVYHCDVGLKGGVRSTIAETLIAKAHDDPAFTHRQARELLDRYEFPADQQRRLELDLAVHYQKHKVIPHWAEAYRRTERLPAPQPGPPLKRKDPPSPAAQGLTSGQPGLSAVPAMPTGVEHWQRWGRPLDEATALQQIEVQPPVFRLPGEPASAGFVRIDGSRYDILPCGASRHPSIVFLKNPAPLEDGFSGLNQMIRRDRFDQPSMASCQNGRWTVHGPLFRLPIQDLVEEARPGLTSASYRILAEKIFDAADQAHTGLTATRLINIKATLNAWKKGQHAPLPRLNDPLLMLEGSRMTATDTVIPRLWISYGPSLRDFTRLDFLVRELSLTRLLETLSGGAQLGVSAKTAMRDFMSALLNHAGYRLVSANEAVLKVRSVVLFQRPGQEQLYLLKTRLTSAAQVELHRPDVNSAIPLSNRWIDEWAAAWPRDNTLKTLVEARDQGRLVKLVGGVRTGSRMDSGPQVFVQRVVTDG
ncbi:dermonecrotic toxin domain-containing protein [Pseudomonas sp. LP_7_YM]|uniref:dermonecrotic toxin domain-containing protein n=1 Tax=Pseudomonas sp. LP_7_YM TaxID=2485137 RepID=UPI00105E0DCE|nr:DUF6543 domain-containing protein [Pseudomonas sp. LP_7_YM]TDV67928.1 hypothetical protein EC915_103466 [Pseudomonas sp. LP_7_YM]